MRLGDVLEGKRVVVCAGAGGVGKTTAAAAIALGMARRGRRVLVLTIDPARRLAGALGLPDTGDEAHRVELDGAGAGELHAMMLDAKRTFDDLVAEYAPTPEACERILSNRIYRQLSGAVAGSQEYMAMEKVYELHRSGLYDLLVLDTPPTRNALDFLEAPGRLTRFIEGKTLRLLLRPGARVLGSGSALAFKVLERLTGMALLRDLSEFLAGFDGMYDGFRERADRVSKLLASKDTTFLLVTVPEEEPIAEADFFWRALVEHGMPFGGVIVNKVHPSYITGRRSRRSLRPRAEQELIGAGATAATAARAAENLMHYQALADRDRANIERLARRIGSEPLIEVPHLDHDVHDLDGLAQVGTHLYG